MNDFKLTISCLRTPVSVIKRSIELDIRSTITCLMPKESRRNIRLERLNHLCG
jgi:hypothetical protein